MFNLPQQPQSIGNIFNNGMRLYCVGFKKIIALLLFSSFLIILPNLLAYFLGIDIHSDTMEWTPSVFLIIILSILSTLLTYVIYSAISIQFWGIMHSDIPSIKASLKRGLVCFLPIFFASILCCLAIIFGLVLLIVPGIMLSVSLFFFGYFILFERDGIIASLKHSYQLVRGNWWRVATIHVVAAIIIMFIMVLIALFPFLFFGTETIMVFFEDMHERANLSLPYHFFNFLFYIIYSLLMSLLNAISLVLFHDLKMRKTDDGLQPSLEKLS